MSDTEFTDDATPIVAEWLNDINDTVYRGLGAKDTPDSVRQFIEAEKAGEAGSVQGKLDLHKADVSIHFPDAPNDGTSYVRRSNGWVAEGTISQPQTDHTLLSNLNAADQHPISGVIGLADKLDAYDGHLASYHIPQPPSDGVQYAIKDNVWTAVAGGGNLLSSGAVPMDAAYSPSVAKDIATKDYVDSSLGIQKTESSVTLSGGATYLISDEDMGRVIRCGGNGATTTIQIPDGIMESGTFSIINQGGTTLQVDIVMTGTDTVNGASSKTDIMSYDKGAYVAKINATGWHVVA